MTIHHAEPPLDMGVATTNTSKQRWTDALIQAQPSVLLLRDGELVLYRRTHSLLYQCRFKLADDKWHRYSTRKASLENAIAAACNMYDEARYRQRLGLAHRTHTFAQIALITLAEMRKQIDTSKGLTAYHSYITCIEKYFLPYFGTKVLEELTHTDVREFEMWRDRQMARKPKTSTLNNFTSAWNRVSMLRTFTVCRAGQKRTHQFFVTLQPVDLLLKSIDKSLLIILWSAVQVRDALPFQTVKSLCTTLQSDFFLRVTVGKHPPIIRV